MQRVFAVADKCPQGAVLNKKNIPPTILLQIKAARQHCKTLGLGEMN